MTPRRRSRSNRRWLVAGVVAGVTAVLVLGIAALRNSADQAATAAAGGWEPAQVRAAAGGAQVGDTAPAFSAKALDGQQISVPAGRPTALFFFAAWCTSCIPEAAALAELHRAHGDEVTVLAVDIDARDTTGMIANFMGAAGNPAYPVVHDRDGSLQRAFRVAALDTTVVVDAAGKVAYRDAVPSTAGQLTDGLRRAGARL